MPKSYARAVPNITIKGTASRSPKCFRRYVADENRGLKTSKIMDSLFSKKTPKYEFGIITFQK